MHHTTATRSAFALATTMLAATTFAQNPPTVSIHGEQGLRRWHAIACTLDGPTADEAGTPNPFLDLRMNVTFAHAATGTSYLVAGHFAADGDAANTSATAGNKWRAWLAPDHVGTWTWSISFRKGADVAIANDPLAGIPASPYDGATGSFEVVETDKAGRDHRARGRLRYVGRHHLRYADGTWFLKAGADSPENLLAYDDIDNTPDIGNRRKSWSPHLPDWRPGDPAWQGTKGKALIGALNYLAGEGLNAFSFLTYNHNGDDKNVYPHVDPNDRVRMDCSKLDQWNVVLTHGDRLGLYLHFKTQEQENDQDMDGGALGTERKLYYRELVSRFAHHLALNWNLGEENTNTTAQRIAFARWIADLDPYDHLIVVHTFPGQKNAVYTPLLGTASELTGASLQSGPGQVFGDTRTWRNNSAAAGKPWVVANDEQGNAQTGIKPDLNDRAHDEVRRDVLWGNLMAGGAGIECYFGYGFAHSDLSCEDFRSRDLWWDQCRFALRFFADHRVPFQDMQNDDALLAGGNGHCLAGSDQWVVYLDSAGANQSLDLTGGANVAYDVAWYDPRQGGALEHGSVTTVQGGAVRGLGAPPNNSGVDWVVLVRQPGVIGASIERYGAACAQIGTLDAATLVADGLPELGSTSFALRTTFPADAVPQPPRLTALLAGFGPPVAAPIGGCTILVTTDVALLATTDAGGVAHFPVAIPATASLLGSEARFQSVLEESQGPLLGIATTSNAIAAVLGR